MSITLPENDNLTHIKLNRGISVDSRVIYLFYRRFNDEHVQPKLIQQIKSKPIIVITKELTPKTKEAIIDGDCKNYILMEESCGNHTKIYSSNQGEHTIEGFTRK